MTDTQRIIQLFELIRLLQERPGKRIKELQRQFGKSRSTIYRYLDILNELGYEVDQDVQRRYFLVDLPPHNLADELTTEEAQLMRQLVEGGAENHALKDSLLAKLDRHIDPTPSVGCAMNQQRAQVAVRLSLALERGLCVRLLRYYSPSSETVTNRLVLPLNLCTRKRQMNALELEVEGKPVEPKPKQFKVHRIRKVELTTRQAHYDGPILPFDIFGVSGESIGRVELRLSFRAVQLLREEFPGSEAFIGPRGADGWFPFVSELIFSHVGVGRFCLGLPGEVEVVGPESLMKYCRDKVLSL